MKLSLQTFSRNVMPFQNIETSLLYTQPQFSKHVTSPMLQVSAWPESYGASNGVALSVTESCLFALGCALGLNRQRYGVGILYWV